MPIATVKQVCKPNAIVTSDSFVEQVAQIDEFATNKIDGHEFFRRNYFTDGLKRLVMRGFERLAGNPKMARFTLRRPWAGAKHTA